MDNQINKGSNNINQINSNNRLFVNINIDALDILKLLNKAFDDKDKEINEKIPNNVLVNKTNAEVPFQTNKILMSLLKSGIPLAATFEIIEKTLIRLNDFINANQSSTICLTTKEIRKMIAESIAEIDDQKFSRNDIEDWSNQYIRRYGHNNKKVMVYYPESGKTEQINYKFIIEKLGNEIVLEITKGLMKLEDIPASHKSHVSREILSFINSCDLYKINYNVLKQMIKEIVLQPPHPWFISNETREEIVNYDLECLECNIKKLKSCIENKSRLSQTLRNELLHHSSAIILEKYNYFLGCYDLSSFYLLRELLNNLNCNDKWDLILDYSKLSNILSDLTFSNINVDELLTTINKLFDYLQSQNTSENMDFNNLLMKFIDYTLKIIKIPDKEILNIFLNSNWKDYELKDIIKYIKLMLYSIVPVKKWNLDTTKNYFWIKYKFLDTSIEIRKQLFFIYIDNNITDYSFLTLLEDPGNQVLCNTILIVTETCDEIFNNIFKFLKNNEIAKKYIILWIDKNDFQGLLKSQNKLKFFDNLMTDHLEKFNDLN